MSKPNSIFRAVMAHDHELVLLINCKSERYSCCHATRDYESLPGQGDYHEALITASEQIVYPSDRRHFLHSLKLEALKDALERSEQRVLFRRFTREGHIVWVETRFFAHAEGKEIVLTCTPNSPPQAVSEKKAGTPDIAPYQRDMQMGDNIMFTNFLVADLASDRFSRAPLPDPNVSVPGSFTEQIQWFADNVLVPEQREHYLQFFDPAHLVPLLRRNRGYYCAHFTLQLSRERHDIANVLGLLPDPGDPDRELLFTYALDITSMQELQERSLELLQKTRLDALTGIANRQSAENDIAHFLHVQPEDESSLLLILDIDYFKRFNDDYGHEVGDRVLTYIARTLKSTFRNEDIVGRWGGDEFLVFLKNFRSMEAVTRRLRTLCATLEAFVDEGLNLPISLSIGGAVATGTQSCVQELFRLADTALYIVKREGRNGFVYFTDAYVRGY